ncbi:Uncharacterised protein g6270 [Pycnogonum litorale]
MFVCSCVSGAHFIRNNDVSEDFQSLQDVNIYPLMKKNWIVLAPRQQARQSNQTVLIHNYLHDVTELEGVNEWNILVVLPKSADLLERHPENVYVISHEHSATLNYSIMKNQSDSVNFRRMVGYIFAIENGAQVIYDADETISLSHLPHYDVEKRKRYLTPQTNASYNPFQHFGQSELWPRGFEVPYDVNSEIREYKLSWHNTPCIQHSIWQGFPDLNHVFYNQHIVNRSDEGIFFDTRSPPIVIPNGVLVPYGAANTIYTRDAFWSLFLPPSRRNEADIFRSLWTEKLLPKHDAIMFQLSDFTRSVIDEESLHDVSSDLPNYLEFLISWKCDSNDLMFCLGLLNSNLLSKGFWNETDAIGFENWMEDLHASGYNFDLVRHVEEEEEDATSKFISEKNVLYFPVEKRHPFNVKSKLAPELETMVEAQRSECPDLPTDMIKDAMKSNHSHFSDVVLHIAFNRMVAVHRIIPVLKLMYKHRYPSMMICGPAEGMVIAKKNRISYIASYLLVSANAQNHLDCDIIVQLMNYNASGVMKIHDDLIIHSWKMTSWNKSKIWFTPPHYWLVASADIIEDVVLNPDGSYYTVLNGWNNSKAHPPDAKNIFDTKDKRESGSVIQPPRWFRGKTEVPKVLEVFKEFLSSAPGTLRYRCHTNLMLRLHGKYRIDFAQADHFYVPRRLFKDFAELLLLFLKHNLFFEYAIPSMLKCMELPEYHRIIPFRHTYPGNHWDDDYTAHLRYTYVHPIKIGPLLNDAKKRKNVFCDLILKHHLTTKHL